MPKVAIRFVGAGFGPRDKIAAMLEPDLSFEAQLPQILPFVKMDEMTFRGLKLNHVTKDKQKGPVLHLTDTPAMLDKESMWVWMTKTDASGKPVAPVKAPPAAPPGKTAPPAAAAHHDDEGTDGAEAVPPPPPPKRPIAAPVAVESSGGDIPAPPPPRPPTVKSAGIPAPPPPRPVSPAHRPAGDAPSLPPPPPMPRSKSPARADVPPAPPPPPPRPKAVTQHIPVATVEHDADGGEGITISIPASSSSTAPQARTTPPSAPQARKTPPSSSAAAAGGLHVPGATANKAPSRSTSPAKAATAGSPSGLSANRPPGGARSAVPSRNTSPVKPSAAAAAEPTSPAVAKPAAKPATAAKPAAPLAFDSHHQAADNDVNAGRAPSMDSSWQRGGGADTSAMINVAIQEKFQALQKEQLDAERRRIEALEQQVVQTLGRETAALRAHINAETEEQRAKVLQAQTAVETERALFLQNHVARESEVHEAWAKIVAEYQAKAANASAGNPAIEDLRLANAELREALHRREEIARQQDERAASEVSQVVKVQAQLLAAMNEFHRQTAATSALGASLPSSAGGANVSDGSVLDAVDVASQDALVRFLSSIGLGKFLPAMQQHDVDFAALRKMSEADLTAIGVNTIGARKKILLELKHLEQKDTADDDPGAPLSREARMVAATGSASSGGLSTVEFRRHERILRRFFERVEPQLVPRVETIIRQFSRQLDALYSGLTHRYEINLSPYRPAMVAFLRREGFHFLLPAVDVILFSYANREAEFAERVVLEQLKQTQEPMTWLVFQATRDESPRRVPPPPGRSPTSRRHPTRSRASSLVGRHDASGSATPQSPHLQPPGGGGNDFAHAAAGGGDYEGSEYYYSALVDLAQWEFPRLGSRERLACVLEVPLRSIPHPGGRLLEANPQHSDIRDAQSVNHRYIAATIALLMRKDPMRLTQFAALRKQYSGTRDVEYERGQGSEQREDAPFNAKSMYLDVARWYAAHHDHNHHLNGNAGSNGERAA